ncbi:hypothetical protein HXX76_015138 [Chlamydomonas incerta]|uniref:Uncharacterized protein n=1 Tax=Chlamydomonas incerta TaxID=51695 RepID=A0A835SNF6_CHLIN|nr:hypothetical protein HXX76_015138 [Chlamydomonas incerta]|eukprot:KAG2423620.1 hypothetical protein HXX76_015138 [Chlamydomonas incerta]
MYRAALEATGVQTLWCFRLNHGALTRYGLAYCPGRTAYDDAVPNRRGGTTVRILHVPPPGSAAAAGDKDKEKGRGKDKDDEEGGEAEEAGDAAAGAGGGGDEESAPGAAGDAAAAPKRRRSSKGGAGESPAGKGAGAGSGAGAAQERAVEDCVPRAWFEATAGPSTPSRRWQVKVEVALPPGGRPLAELSPPLPAGTRVVERSGLRWVKYQEWRAAFDAAPPTSPKPPGGASPSVKPELCPGDEVRLGSSRQDLVAY